MKNSGIVLVFEKSVIRHIIPHKTGLRRSPDLLAGNSYFMR